MILALVALWVCSSAVAAGTVEVVSIHSTALADNLTGDPVEQTFKVYLPPSYHGSNGRRYAVFFLLHGIGDTSDVWLNYFHVPELLDELMARGSIAEMIVVMPNAKNRFWGSYYANSPVTGHWEDFIAQEIVARVDHDFRTIGTPASRAVVGHSMGGFGAIRLAMHRPDVFPIVYAMSPCCLDAIDYSDFRDKLPLQEIGKYRENLRRLRALAIDYGFRDQFAHIPPATSAFSKALNDAHIAHVLESYDGDHRQMITERLRTTVFPFISRTLEH